jgi:hypothetical protein
MSPSLHNINAILDKLFSIDLSTLGSNLYAAKKQIDVKLAEIDFLKNVYIFFLIKTFLKKSAHLIQLLKLKDENQRHFILTRLVQENGKIQWGFNLNSIRNHVRDVMEFPNFTKKIEKPTLFLGGAKSNYITYLFLNKSCLISIHLNFPSIIYLCCFKRER